MTAFMDVGHIAVIHKFCGEAVRLLKLVFLLSADGAVAHVVPTLVQWIQGAHRHPWFGRNSI